MRTLDETIKGIEYCLNPVDELGNCNGGCPYCPSCDPEGTAIKLDALHYLKEYQRDKQIFAYDIAKRNLELSERNDPLTWNELKQMVGKPVWVEALLYKQWAVIGYVGENHIRFEGVSLYAPESRTYMGNGWQAYKKERVATGGSLILNQNRRKSVMTPKSNGEKMKDWSVEILRYPTEEDWKRCLMLARCTQGKFDTPKEPTDDWKKKILRSEHSPIRTLMFTIKMENIPYCNSVHFVRHKYGVEHYVQSQRKNPERGAERQDAPVTHIMDINAQELIFMARKRLCFKADLVTHEIMAKIVYEICKKDDIYRGLFAPACNCNEKNCREFKPCGMFSAMKEIKS